MTKKWSMKYKKSINCNKPKGFSQKQHCKYRRNMTTNRNNKTSRRMILKGGMWTALAGPSVRSIENTDKYLRPIKGIRSEDDRSKAPYRTSGAVESVLHYGVDKNRLYINGKLDPLQIYNYWDELQKIYWGKSEENRQTEEIKKVGNQAYGLRNLLYEMRFVIGDYVDELETRSPTESNESAAALRKETAAELRKIFRLYRKPSFATDEDIRRYRNEQYSKSLQGQTASAVSSAASSAYRGLFGRKQIQSAPSISPIHPAPSISPLQPESDESQSAPAVQPESAESQSAPDVQPESALQPESAIAQPTARGGGNSYTIVPQTTNRLYVDEEDKLVPIYNVKNGRRYFLHKETEPGLYHSCIFRNHYFIRDDGGENVHITDTYLQNQDDYKVYYIRSKSRSKSRSRSGSRSGSRSRGVAV